MAYISVILPTYNESENIAEQIGVIQSELNGHDFEIIVVDDDSPDGTAGVVKSLMPDMLNLRLRVRKAIRGLVPSIKEGISAAAGEICIWMDADLSMPASSIVRLIGEIEAGADLAVGSRYVDGGGIKGGDENGNNTSLFSLWRNLRDSEDSIVPVALSKYGNLVVRKILDESHYDYTSGYYAVRKSTIETLGLRGNYLDYCIDLLYKASVLGYTISEIPVVIVARKHGVSKTSPNNFRVLPIVWDCLKTVVKLKWQYRRNG
jgi:dolichol-phosphate mannosyltransferase